MRCNAERRAAMLRESSRGRVQPVSRGHLKDERTSNFVADTTSPRDWRRLRTPPDGRCFYHAVVAALAAKGACGVTVTALQNAVVEQLGSLQSPSARQRIALDRARRFGTWAEDAEVSAAAEAIGVRIKVYERDNRTWIAFDGLSQNVSREEDRTTIYLYNNGSHYDALVR